VATTRPETLLGDTAVAVNPEDERYRDFHGAMVRLPILGRKIPVITDSYVSMEFGTGALKVTPAHDFHDFEIARRHGLPAVKALDEHGIMTEEAGKYQGLDRFACREKILKDLKSDGLLEKVERYSYSIGHCYRCRTIVEPMISKQWFVAVKTLAEPAMAAVREGRIKLIPDTWENSFFDWMTNIRDWCISRQIWWGHRIPAWTCTDCGQETVSRQDPSWPDDTPELKIFYPTSVLVTAFDILFFWVARMMMMGIHVMQDVPFREVYIHALVRDPEGRKMSKSRGNIIDPLDLMDTYGTDAFRFSLAAFAAMGRDIRLSEERIIGYRNFVNKVWNACRFTLMNLGDYDPEAAQDDLPLTVIEAWITSRLQQVIRETINHLDAYDFDQAAHVLYQFIWHEFCDWYLELIKPNLAAGADPQVRQHTQRVLVETLGTILRLLHPFMPFITEEVWHKLPGAQGSIMVAPFPQPDVRLENPQAEAEIRLLMDTIIASRNLRAEMNVPASSRVENLLFCQANLPLELLARHSQDISRLARVSEVRFNPESGRPAASAATVVAIPDLIAGELEGEVKTLEIVLPLEGVIDFREEERRLNREMDKLSRDLAQAQKKLANEWTSFPGTWPKPRKSWPTRTSSPRPRPRWWRRKRSACRHYSCPSQHLHP